MNPFFSEAVPSVQLYSFELREHISCPKCDTRYFFPRWGFYVCMNPRCAINVVFAWGAVGRTVRVDEVEFPSTIYAN